MLPARPADIGQPEARSADPGIAAWNGRPAPSPASAIRTSSPALAPGGPLS